MTWPETASLILALTALWVAWDIRRRTTQHILKVIDAYAHTQIEAGPPRTGWHSYTVCFKNLGLAISDMSVVISLRVKDGDGSFMWAFRSIPTRGHEGSMLVNNVASGQVIRFELRTSEIDDAGATALASLEDFRKQDARIAVLSSGYSIKQMALGSARYRFGEKVQPGVSWVWRALRLDQRRMDPISLRLIIRGPRFDRLTWSLRQFLRHLQAPRWREDLDAFVRSMPSNKPAPHSKPSTEVE